MSMLEQFQVLMSLPETQCECCVVSGIVCVCVCVCVCGKPLRMYVCVRTTFLSMLGQFQVLIALLETQLSAVFVCGSVCVCVVFVENLQSMTVRKNRWCLCVSCVCVCRTTFVSMLGQVQVPV